METLIQAGSRLSRQDNNYSQGKGGPFEGVVVQVSPLDDSLGISFGPVSNRPMPVQHPYLGSNSWIRAMPYTGTRYLMINRFDSGQPEIIKPLPIGQIGSDGTSATGRSAQYTQQSNIYRTLNPGEHDIASVGMALSFYGRRGNLDHRAGGVIKHQLDRDGVQIVNQAPTIKHNLLNWTVGQMGDELRIGTVKRWKSAISETYAQDANNNFQSEYFLHLKNPAGSAPAVLLQKTEGQVYDSTGALVKQFSTAHNLRSQTLWYTKTDDIARFEVDENGNMYTSLPSIATTGYELNIAQGNYKATIGVDRDVIIGRDEQVGITGNTQYTIGADMTYKVNGTILIKETTGNAALKISNGQVALGTSTTELLQQIINALMKIGTFVGTTAANHTHIGNLGLPTLPPQEAAQFVQLMTDLAQIQQLLTTIKGSF
jgi:hypothetical protein